MLSIMGLAMFLVSQVSGEKYEYNQTESELRDALVTQVCIDLNIDNPVCDMVYGGNPNSDGKLESMK
jgi:hypothetical protein